MKKIYQGKTKDVFELDDTHVLLKFKDDVTGKDGVFDPGENQVGLQIKGAGHAAVALTKYFYEKINQHGINTHFVAADLNKNEAIVKKASIFGKGVEVIVRYRAVGSFYRRFGAYIEEGANIPSYVEITLKDDDRQDPVVSAEVLELLKIMTIQQYNELVELAREIGNIVKEDLKNKQLDLFDIKFEFGEIDGCIVLIDEISGGNMRVFENGVYLPPLELEKKLLH